MAKRIREKALARAENADKRPRAVASYVRISPSKVRIVLDLIRGANYNDALAILAHAPKAAAKPVRKLIESAGANAENNLNMNKDGLIVAEAFANEGPTLKRWWPRSHGSADTIRKRTSHITIILDEAEVKSVPASKTKLAKELKTNTKPKAAAPKAKAEVKADTTPAKPAAAKAESKPKAATTAKSAAKPAVAKPATAKPAAKKPTATAAKPAAATKTTKGGAK